MANDNNTSIKSNSKTNNRNVKKELTAFQKEQLVILKRIQEYKLSAEASAVSIFYKCPEKIIDTTLVLDDLTNNCWRVYFAIAYGIIVTERKASLSEIDINFFLEKHPNLRQEYENNGGYSTIEKATTYVDEKSLDGYIDEIKKWNAVIKMVKFGYMISEERLKELVDMTAEEIYNEQEGYLNHVFANVDTEIKTYDALSGLHELVDELNKGSQNGLPITAELLNKEIGGLRLGNIYGIIGVSGAGKSTLAMNYILPSIMRENERCCIIINEEDEKKS